MDGKLLARVGAVVFVALAITATAIEMTRKEDEPSSPVSGPMAAAPADPLRAELMRCQGLGEAGPRDPASLRAWAEYRERILAPGARPRGRVPDPVAAPRPQSETSIEDPAGDPVRKESAPVPEEEQ
jgi:conjugative transfer region protein TrbK